MLGEKPTIADFSMVGYHYYDEETTIDRDAFPHMTCLDPPHRASCRDGSILTS